jgi:hypothetical protein
VLVPPPVRYEQTNPLIAYRSTWATATAPIYSGGSMRLSSASGAGFTVAFTGTGIDWLASVGKGYGNARVTLDGATSQTVSLYAAAYGDQKVVYSVSGLTEGPHTIKVERLATPGAGGGTAISLDALDVTGVLTQPAIRYEDSDRSIDYRSSWPTASSSVYSGGTMRLSSASAAGFTVHFNGTGIDWLATVGPGYGNATVILDGVTTQTVTVNLYAASHEYQKSVYAVSGLTNGPHTLRVNRSSTPGAGGGTAISLDALDVKGTLTPPVRFEQDNALLAYRGSTWATATSSVYSGNSMRLTSGAGSGFTLYFTGTRVDWIATVGPGYGNALVTLDGVTTQTVSLYAATHSYQKVVYSKSGLTDGPHTLRVDRLSTPGDGGGTAINLDALDVRGELTPPVTRFEQDNPDLRYLGSGWSTATASVYSGNSMRLTSVSGTGFSAYFTGTGIDWIASVGPGYGNARVTIDGAATQTVSLYSATYGYQRSVFSVSGLGAGGHVLKVDRLSTPGTGGGTAISIDALDVKGMLTPP